MYLYGFGYVRLCSACTYFIAEAGDEVRQVLQLFRVGQVVDTVRKHFGFLVLRHTSYLFCYGLVSEQHEFFHQFIGIF